MRFSANAVHFHKGMLGKKPDALPMLKRSRKSEAMNERQQQRMDRGTTTKTHGPHLRNMIRVRLPLWYVARAHRYSRCDEKSRCHDGIRQRMGQVEEPTGLGFEKVKPKLEVVGHARRRTEWLFMSRSS